MATTTKLDTPDVAEMSAIAPRVIEPRRPGIRARVRELRGGSRLLRFFARRNIEQMYANTILGRTWLVLRPVLGVGTYAFAFGTVIKAPSAGVPYVLFVLVGWTFWFVFERTWWTATRGLEGNSRLIGRMYFPYLLLIVAAPVGPLVTYAVSMVLVALAMVGFVVFENHLYLNLEWTLPLVVPALGVLLLAACALGLWTAVWALKGRDIRWTVRYVCNFWMFLTPVVYPLSAVPEPGHTLMQLNPLTAPVEMYKGALLGTPSPPLLAYASTAAAVGVILLGGLWFFTRYEAFVADNV